ncbi:MAG TPA: hypothetical protein VFZ70_14040 [Euzebyales bacterium]
MSPPPVRVRSLVALMVLAMSLLAAPTGAAAANGRLTNLDHLEFLTTEVTPPEQAGHTTYQLDEDPSIGMLWTYAEPGEDGYVRIGGGTYDPATDTYGQGAYNADDISRAAVVFLRHWQQFGDASSREHAYGLLRGLTYLQTVEGEHRGNVVLWMQPDGTLNPSAEPVELPNPSDSGPSYWLARTIWALGEGYAAFAGDDPVFAAFLEERLQLAIAAVERQVLEPDYPRLQQVDGLAWPAWLIADGADASSEAVYGLAAYVEATGDERAEAALRKLAEGIALMGDGDVRTWPFRALLPWAQSRTVWHAWGDQMAGALARAGTLMGEPDWIQAAVDETGSFTPHLLVQNGPENGWLPAPADRTQIAYGADATLQNLLGAQDATGRDAFTEVAAMAAAWYFGNNPAGEQMYDPGSGRTFDGINPDGVVNRNSGAESTIHGLLSMLALDARPELAERAHVASRIAQVTWQLVEAEDGTVRDDATVVTADPAWTGESLFTGGAYVELGHGGHVSVPVDLPTADAYHVMPVFWRERAAAGVTRHLLDGRMAGAERAGGAGPQGVTPEPGYLEVGSTDVVRPVGPGEVPVEARRSGGGDAVRVDATLVQPNIEWLLLAGEGEAQGLLRSFDRRTRWQELHLGDVGDVHARSYDDQGRLVNVTTGEDGAVRARVAPGGFTTVSSG